MLILRSHASSAQPICTQNILSLPLLWGISYFLNLCCISHNQMYSQTINLSRELILGIKMVRIDLCKNFTLKIPCRHQDSNQRPTKPDSYLLTGFGHFHGLAPHTWVLSSGQFSERPSSGCKQAVWNTVPTFL